MSKRKPPSPQISSEPEPSRPGPRDAKGVIAERIVAAARSLFATNGYASTSLRAVAEAAGVDVALVSYYFKNKAGLLDAVLEVPSDLLAAHAARIAETSIEERAKTMVSVHLALWEDPRAAEIFRAAILAAANEPAAMERLRQVYGGTLERAAQGLPEDDRSLRIGLAASQFLGMAMLRYVWRIGPLVDIPIDEIVRILTPAIDRYLRGDLGE